MPKSEVVDAARGKDGRVPLVHLPNVVEGQIAELCRDLSVQAKRLRQLQEQADELQVLIRQWAGGAEARTPRGSTNRGGGR